MKNEILFPPRVANWPTLLNAHITKSVRQFKKTGIVWGEFDCCTYAFDWVFLATGVDYMADFRGHYKTEKGAFRALRDIGSGDLLSTVSDRMERKPAAFAQRGDLAFHDDDRALGIFIAAGGRCHAAFMSDEGFATAEAIKVSHGFRV